MPKITHAGVSYEPGHEPPGWVPPVPDEPEAIADEPEVPAVAPKAPPRRPPAAPDGA